MQAVVDDLIFSLLIPYGPAVWCQVARRFTAEATAALCGWIAACPLPLRHYLLCRALTLGDRTGIYRLWMTRSDYPNWAPGRNSDVQHYVLQLGRTAFYPYLVGRFEDHVLYWAVRQDWPDWSAFHGRNKFIGYLSDALVDSRLAWRVLVEQATFGGYTPTSLINELVRHGHNRIALQLIRRYNWPKPYDSTVAAAIRDGHGDRDLITIIELAVAGPSSRYDPISITDLSGSLIYDQLMTTASSSFLTAYAQRWPPAILPNITHETSAAGIAWLLAAGARPDDDTLTVVLRRRDQERYALLAAYYVPAERWAADMPTLEQNQDQNPEQDHQGWAPRPLRLDWSDDAPVPTGDHEEQRAVLRRGLVSLAEIDRPRRPYEEDTTGGLCDENLQTYWWREILDLDGWQYDRPPPPPDERLRLALQARLGPAARDLATCFRVDAYHDAMQFMAPRECLRRAFATRAQKLAEYWIQRVVARPRLVYQLWRLVVTRNWSAGRHLLRGNGWTLGAAPTGDVELDDPNCSRVQKYQVELTVLAAQADYDHTRLPFVLDADRLRAVRHRLLATGRSTAAAMRLVDRTFQLDELPLYKNASMLTAAMGGYRELDNWPENVRRHAVQLAVATRDDCLLNYFHMRSDFFVSCLPDEDRVARAAGRVTCCDLWDKYFGPPPPTPAVRRPAAATPLVFYVDGVAESWLPDGPCGETRLPAAQADALREAFQVWARDPTARQAVTRRMLGVLRRADWRTELKTARRDYALPLDAAALIALK